MGYETYINPSPSYFDFHASMARIIAIKKQFKITRQETGICYDDDHNSDGELCFTCYEQQKHGI